MSTRRFRAPRWQVSMECRFVWDDPQFEAPPQEGRLRELSAEGAFVQSGSLPEAGTKIVLAFRPEDQPEELEFLAKVIHSGWYRSADLEEPIQGFGVHFTSSAAETSRRLRRLLEDDISQNSKFARQKIPMRDKELPSEAEIQQRALRYKAFFEEFAHAMMIVGQDGGVLHFNSAARELLGYSLEESAGLGEEDLFTRPSLKRLRRLLDRREGGQIDLTMLRSDGKLVDCRLLVTPRVTGDRAVLGYNAVAVDLRRQQQLEPLYNRQQSLREQGLLARKASAELTDRLSTVLASEESALKALHADPADLTQVSSRLQSSLKSVHASMDLVSQLQLTCGDTAVRLEYVEHPRPLLEGLVEEIRRELPERPDWAIRARLGAGGTLRLERGLLLQALRALIENACLAMPEGGAIEVRTRTESLPEDLPGNCVVIPAGRYTVLSVEDAGEGFGIQPLGDAFLPFTTSRPDRLGLGLAVAWGVASCHRGAVDAHSSPEGSRVEIYLPSRDL